LRQARITGDFENELRVERGPAQASRLRRALRNRRLVTRVVLFAACAVLLSIGAEGRAQTGGSEITIVARDAKTGDAIAHFKWLVNLDNSHQDASVTPPNTYSPVVANGDASNSTVTLPDTVDPDRGYLVTVLANDGAGTQNDPDYKIGGKHFRMPDAAAGNGEVVVELQPNPLPLAALKVRVFHDNGPVNGEDDVPVEEGLAGFHVTLDDVLGQVVTDWFGNPICTEYERDADGNVVFDADGSPVISASSPGFCLSDADGVATIPNLGPDRYEVEVIPPNGSGWIQVSTIEGTFHNDAWVQEGANGYATEPEAGLFPQVWFGFARRCTFGDTGDDCTSELADSTGSGTITGRILSIASDNEAAILSLGNPVRRPYVALTNVGGSDEQVWTGRGNPNGTFTISDVPDGVYQMAVWDFPLDHVIQFFTVRVAGGGTVDLGDLGVPPWFGKIRGSVYIDKNENGVRDPGETGFPNQDLDTRFKDGTIQYGTFADSNGNYEFPEVFELEHFAISEVGYGRFKNTGASAYKTDKYGNPVDYPWVNDCKDFDENHNGYADDTMAPGVCTSGTPARECADPEDWKTCEHGPINQDLGLAGLLQATITWGGTANYIDWGKKAFAPGENGGIVGIVFNDSTRNELDASLQAAEDYAPGIPGVTVNLWAPKLDADGEPMYDPDTGEILKDHLANTYVTDSFYDARPTDCAPVGTLGRDPSQVQPSNIWSDCLELPALLDQTRPGVFDGGYAFEDDCSNPNPDGDDDSDGTPNRNDADSLATDCAPVAAGKWVTETEVPENFKVVKEDDVNVFSGDTFVPQVPPPPCVGPLHTVNVVDDPSQANFDSNDPSHTQGVYNPDFLATTGPQSPDGGSPFEGRRMPLCSEKLIDLQQGFNANSDFMVFTDVPEPGRIRGVLLDDLTLDLDPNSPLYGEKRGIPNAPIGIRDFTGKLVTTVYSDANGTWEVLLPSTGTYNCPLPAGPCPGMYYVVGNDPGDIQNPDPKWNPNYQTLPLVFEVWPNLTTYADVAIIPTTTFVQAPGTQFAAPPECNIGPATPDLRSVSQPYGNAGDSFTISGAGFGASQGAGSVTLDGAPLDIDSWNNAAIGVTIPSGEPAGPHQLLVHADNGDTSPSGLTFHVLGAGYNPPITQVHAGDDLQAVLDAADDGDLIVVEPGVYSDKIILHSNVKLQGYGPGATVLDGRFIVGAHHLDHAAFDAKMASIPHDGAPTVPWGQTITVLAEDGQFHSGFNPQIDGFKIMGGRNEMGNGTSPGEGGGVYVHGFARHLEVSNNLVQNNSGTAGAGIILGLPTAQLNGLADNQNDNIRVHHNRVLNNGGVVLAGGVAIFNGAENYEVDHNVVCGNYSAEYGAGISHWGKSPGGRIHDNDVLFNFAFDEGGGIMVAGELTAGGGVGTGLSPGSGDVTIARNLIRGNVSNDDGGGIRLLNPVAGHVRIANNMVANNLATDTGGGISVDDALSVDIVNNTLSRNISTGTAEDADRSTCSPVGNGTCAHGAGLVSEGHSPELLNAVADGDYDCSQVNCTSNFSDPVLFNNVFWQNEAFRLTGTGSGFDAGLASSGFKDLEVLPPAAGHFTKSSYNDCTALSANCPGASNNIAADPQFVQQVDTQFEALAFAGDPSFITVMIKSNPSDPPGNYHLLETSPAIDAGAASQAGVDAPADDFDGQARPIGPGFDIGADERAGAAPAAATPPSLVGIFALGQTIQVVPGTWNGPAGTSFSYKLQRCDSAGDNCEDIPGATGPDYIITIDDIGHTLRVVETGSNPYGDTPATSDPSTVVTATPPPPTAWYLSFGGNGSAGSVAFRDEDILSFDGTNFAIFFDGSDVGLGPRNVDAFALLDADSLLLSFSAPLTIPGLGLVDDSDIVRFDAGSLGTTTSGTFKRYFDGSDVGLTTDAEDVDAIERLANGRLLISTTGKATVGALVGRDEDLLRFRPASLGGSTSGSWTMYFDGSDVGLGTAVGEDVDAASVAGGKIYLSTVGHFGVPGRSGANEDIFSCTYTSLGATTACSWSAALAFDGSAFGLGPYNVDAIEKG
jgi:IPT/TIG domain-containing protein